MSIGWARLELQDRFVQMACGIRERMLSSQLWHAGVQYARADTTEFKVAGALVKAWLIDRIDLSGLEKKFGRIEIAPGAVEFEAGRAVDYAWNQTTEWLESGIGKVVSGSRSTTDTSTAVSADQPLDCAL